MRPVGNVIGFNRWVDEELPGASGKAEAASYPPDFLLAICFWLAMYVGMYHLNTGNY